MKNRLNLIPWILVVFSSISCIGDYSEEKLLQNNWKCIEMTIETNKMPNEVISEIFLKINEDGTYIDYGVASPPNQGDWQLVDQSASLRLEDDTLKIEMLSENRLMILKEENGNKIEYIFSPLKK